MDGQQRLFRKLEVRDALSAAERQALSNAGGAILEHAAGEMIVVEGERQTSSRLLLDGVAARSKLVPDGRRQITELHFSGDFVDLHSFLLKRLDHDIVALTPARTQVFPHEALRVITETQPHLTRMLWLSTMLDAAVHREWLVSAGRRTALEQVACLFCEVYLRSEIVGLAQDGRCPLPITQHELADACGLTPVHANRVLQDLRRDGLVEWRGGELVIPDFERLAQAGGFDPAYLDLERLPR